jgi:soluble epoxide hydrolase / lipid-phosphate phosphatase
MKSTANDMAELLRQLDVPKVVLLGHDWGGVVVSRIYMHHPSLISHIISICVPIPPKSTEFIPLEDLVATVLPNFKYLPLTFLLDSLLTHTYQDTNLAS